MNSFPQFIAKRKLTRTLYALLALILATLAAHPLKVGLSMDADIDVSR